MNLNKTHFLSGIFVGIGVSALTFLGSKLFFPKPNLSQTEKNDSTKKRKRQKIEVMSEEVVDSNPYSRLMALKKMGIVENYADIRKKTVLIVGLGGIGSVASEMLTRCGIGKLLLFDYDTVEIANMNRLFFTPSQAGMKKTEAAKETLLEINLDVIIETYNYNVTTVGNFEHFLSKIKTGGLNNSHVDLVLGCVDNFEARTSINQACLELGLPWMESGVSEDAMSGHIQFILPGETACFQCAPPLIVASGISEKTLKREGVCAASLSTTMAITAGFLIQNALKYLLGFGNISYYLGYNALLNYFPGDPMKPNPECSNSYCVKHQKTYLEKLKTLPKQEEKVEKKKQIIHEDNEWGITLESSSLDEETNNLQSQTSLVRAWEQDTKKKISEEEKVKVDENLSVEELMNQLKNMSKKD